jgi:nucleoside-diphosphate-sugar epimerase
MTDVVLVVGGTGFIGSHLAERLADAGGHVRVASRRGAWPWGPVPPGIQVVPLDLAGDGAGPDEGIARAMDGATAVVNLAGMLARPGAVRSAYDDLHERGVERLVKAAAERGASSRTDPARPLRFVHVSTTGVLGPTGATPRGEDTTPAPVTDYETSKLAGEKAALAARACGIEVVVVRPGLVYGPRDVHLAPFYRAIQARRYRNIGGSRALWQPVYVTDVARALHLALDAPGADGGVFHVAGAERLSVAAFASRIGEHLGRPIRTWGLSRASAMMAGAILETVCPPLGIEPPLTRSRVRTMTEDRVYAIDRAGEGLGFVPEVPLDEGIRHAVNWYRRHGYL